MVKLIVRKRSIMIDQSVSFVHEQRLVSIEENYQLWIIIISFLVKAKRTEGLFFPFTIYI